METAPECKDYTLKFLFSLENCFKILWWNVLLFFVYGFIIETISEEDFYFISFTRPFTQNDLLKSTVWGRKKKRVQSVT